jgi:hypothetical protein
VLACIRRHYQTDRRCTPNFNKTTGIKSASMDDAGVITPAGRGASARPTWCCWSMPRG